MSLESLNPFCREIRQKAQNLEKEIAELKLQLQEKQEHINRTNSYWKKKMHEQKRKVKYVRIEPRNAV